MIDKIRAIERRAGGAGDITDGPMARTKATGEAKPASAARPHAEAGGARTARHRELRGEIDAVDARIHALLNDRARLARAGRHLQARRRPHRRFLPARSARRRCCAWRASATRGRCATKKSCGCSARSCPPAWRRRSRSRSAFLGPGGHVLADGGAQALRPFGARAGAGVGRRGVPRSRGGHADFGVVPVENSTEGTVNNTLDMLLTSPLQICGEVELRIHQYLMGSDEALDEIKRVCAHPQSLAQCRGWLDEHLPDVRARAGHEQCRRRAPRARRGGHGGDRRRDRRRGLRPRRCWRRDRGPRRTTPRAFLSSAARSSSRAATTTPPCSCSALHTRFARRAVPAARAAGEAQDQHDAHRVAAVASQASGTTCSSSTSTVTPTSRTSPRRWPRSRSAPRCSACSGSYPRAVRSTGTLRQAPGPPSREWESHFHFGIVHAASHSSPEAFAFMSFISDASMPAHVRARRKNTAMRRCFLLAQHFLDLSSAPPRCVR